MLSILLARVPRVFVPRARSRKCQRNVTLRKTIISVSVIRRNGAKKINSKLEAARTSEIPIERIDIGEKQSSIKT